MEPISLEHLGMAGAFASSLTWALGSSVYARLALNHSAWGVNFTRALLALPLFAGFEFLTSGWSSALQHFADVQWSNMLWFLLSMICSYGIGDFLFYKCTAILGVPGALAIASTFPIYNLILGVIFLGENLSSLKVIGILVTVIGVVGVIISGKKTQNIEVSKPLLIRGVFLSLLTGMFWAVNAFACARGVVGLTPFVGNTLRMIFALLVISTLAKGWLGKRDRLILPRADLIQKGPIIVLEAFGGSLLFVFGLKYSPLAIGSVLCSLAPVLSVPIAWVSGTEKLSVVRLIWVLLVVAGVSSLVL